MSAYFPLHRTHALVFLFFSFLFFAAQQQTQLPTYSQSCWHPPGQAHGDFLSNCASLYAVFVRTSVGNPWLRHSSHPQEKEGVPKKNEKKKKTPPFTPLPVLAPILPHPCWPHPRRSPPPVGPPRLLAPTCR
jgi:hypothetical protein